MASTSDAALKAEIARLTGIFSRQPPQNVADQLAGAINQHKQRSRPAQAPSSTRDVVIDGVTFESSSRSLVRKGRESPSPVCSHPPVTNSL